MDDQSRFAVYLSHSWWPEDVELNLHVWKEFAEDCELLVDAPKDAGPNPPYYINRIEELLRRTDVFISVLTYRPPKDPSAKLRCSPYSQFEIHLAERADLPRLVLYDRRTGFRPPASKRPWAVYQVFDREEGELLPVQSQWRVAQRTIHRFQEWLTTHRRPLSYELAMDAAVLVDSEAEADLAAELERGLSQANFTPWSCSAGDDSTDTLRRLRETGLVIAEFSAQSERIRQVYAAAHGIGVPAVRLLRSDATSLPWILDGDAGGFREDVVRWSSAAEVLKEVQPRIDAMSRLTTGLADGKATDYLQSKRYAKFSVFLSHSIKDVRRQMIERVVDALKKRQVPIFEYNEHNTAGIDWQAELTDALDKTTHFVALLTDDYERSTFCTYEIEHVLQPNKNVSILPFMLGDRKVAHPKLSAPHHAWLGEVAIDAAADRIVKEVMIALDTANRAPRR